MKLKRLNDPTKLASTNAVVRSLKISFSALVYWISQGAPHPPIVPCGTKMTQMRWGVSDIQALREWMVTHRKKRRKKVSVDESEKLEAAIRRHTKQIEKEMAVPQSKRPDALTLIAQSVHKDLQRRKEKLSPSVVAEIVADALCEQTHGFSPSNELRAALVDAVMPAVVSGMGLLN